MFISLTAIGAYLLRHHFVTQKLADQYGQAYAFHSEQLDTM